MMSRQKLKKNNNYLKLILRPRFDSFRTRSGSDFGSAPSAAVDDVLLISPIDYRAWFHFYLQGLRVSVHLFIRKGTHALKEARQALEGFRVPSQITSSILNMVMLELKEETAEVTPDLATLDGGDMSRPDLAVAAAAAAAASLSSTTAAAAAMGSASFSAVFDPREAIRSRWASILARDWRGFVELEARHINHLKVLNEHSQAAIVSLMHAHELQLASASAEERGSLQETQSFYLERAETAAAEAAAAARAEQVAEFCMWAEVVCGQDPPEEEEGEEEEELPWSALPAPACGGLRHAPFSALQWAKRGSGAVSELERLRNLSRAHESSGRWALIFPIDPGLAGVHSSNQELTSSLLHAPEYHFGDYLWQMKNHRERLGPPVPTGTWVKCPISNDGSGSTLLFHLAVGLLDLVANPLAVLPATEAILEDCVRSGVSHLAVPLVLVEPIGLQDAFWTRANETIKVLERWKDQLAITVLLPTTLPSALREKIINRLPVL
jgi:hypothetical protein